jgi:hypothetical protein
MAISTGVEGTFRLGDVFSKSFSVFGRHFVVFVILAVIANVPYYLFGLFAAPGSTPTFNPWALLVLPVGFVCNMIATGTITYGVVQDLRGGAVSIGQAIAVAAGRFLRMIGVALSVGILMVLMFLPPIIASAALGGGFVGGIATMVWAAVFYCIITCMFFVAAPVCVAERAGVIASLSRSRFLTKGHRWQIFGAFILIFVLALIVVAVAAAAAVVMIGAGGATIVTYGVQGLFGAFGSVLAAVFYYQLRVAKEGVDLAKIASVFD